MSLANKIALLHDLIEPIDESVAEDIRIIAKEVEALTTELAATQEECEMLRKFAQQCSAAVEANQAELAAKTAEVERLREIETAACKVFDLPVWSGEDFYDSMIALKYLLHAQPTEPK